MNSPIIGLLVFFLIVLVSAFAMRLLFVYIDHKPSQYGKVSGNSFMQTVFDKGNYGEFLTFILLENMAGDNKIITNIYLPKGDGSTTEIDLLMINKTGVYVFESKNYGGWIFGNDKSKNWTQSLKGGKKNKFYNPVWQNKAHISALKKFLGNLNNDYIYSYIVFSERCELKNVTVGTHNVFVGKRKELLSTLEKQMSQKPEVLSDSQVSELHETLVRYTLADTEMKEEHIKSIASKIGNR